MQLTRISSHRRAPRGLLSRQVTMVVYAHGLFEVREAPPAGFEPAHTAPAHDQHSQPYQFSMMPREQLSQIDRRGLPPLAYAHRPLHARPVRGMKAVGVSGHTLDTHHAPNGCLEAQAKSFPRPIRRDPAGQQGASHSCAQIESSICDLLTSGLRSVMRSPGRLAAESLPGGDYCLARSTGGTGDVGRDACVRTETEKRSRQQMTPST